MAWLNYSRNLATLLATLPSAVLVFEISHIDMCISPKKLLDSIMMASDGHYRVYQKKSYRTLQCSSAFIIQSTEIILSQPERPSF